MMFTRTVTFSGVDDIDAGLAYVRDEALPQLAQQKGFRGLTASVDRANGVFGVLSMWETEADREASESPMGKARTEAQKIAGGEFAVERFEELLVDIVRPPEVGNALLLRRVSMAPSTIDENLVYFREQILPEIKSHPGFCGLRNMVNRQTGVGLVGTVWTDAAARDAAQAAVPARVERAAARDVTLGEPTRREIVFVDLR
jgi:heme-degrading monooxygenase HmoA